MTRPAATFGESGQPGPRTPKQGQSRNPLLATKPPQAILQEGAETGEHSLKRALGPINLITLGIGVIIGTGIFLLTGQAAAANAGPAIVISFKLAGVGCAFAGLCYAEFASLVPVAGSAHTYGYATLKEIFAWIIGSPPRTLPRKRILQETIRILELRQRDMQATNSRRG